MAVQRAVVSTVGLGEESALGTYSTFADIRATNVTVPWQTRRLADNPTGGHAHPYDTADALPIAYEKCVEGGVSLDVEVRRTLSGASSPVVAQIMESGGCGVSTCAATTVDGYTSTVAWSQAAQGAAAGTAELVELTSGLYHPSLLVSNSGAATYNVVPLVALPDDTESAKHVEIMTTIWPQLRQVPADKTLAIKLSTLMDYSGGSNEVATILSGCALAKGPSIKIAPTSPVKLSLSLHCAKQTLSDSAFAAETLADSSQFAHTNDNLRCDMVTYSASGAIAASPLYLYEATLDPGFATVPIYAGGSTTVGGIQGYLHVPGSPVLTLVADFDITYLTALQSAQTKKEIAIVQPVSALTETAFGLWCHNAHLVGDDAVTVDHKGKSYATVTLKYRLGAGMIAGTETLSSPLSAPWHLAISGASS